MARLRIRRDCRSNRSSLRWPLPRNRKTRIRDRRRSDRAHAARDARQSAPMSTGTPTPEPEREQPPKPTNPEPKHPEQDPEKSRTPEPADTEHPRQPTT